LEINSLGDLEDRKKYKTHLVEFLKKHENELSLPSREKLTNQHVLRILDSKSESDQNIISNAPKILEYLSETK
jgi:histidyl-tRNA synthetase